MLGDPRPRCLSWVWLVVGIERRRPTLSIHWAWRRRLSWRGLSGQCWPARRKHRSSLVIYHGWGRLRRSEPGRGWCLRRGKDTALMDSHLAGATVVTLLTFSLIWIKLVSPTPTNRCVIWPYWHRSSQLIARSVYNAYPRKSSKLWLRRFAWHRTRFFVGWPKTPTLRQCNDEPISRPCVRLL